MTEPKNLNVKKRVSYSTLSSKNQITVPSIVREKLHAEPGDQIVFNYYEESGEITISNVKKDSLLSLYGSMPPKGEKTQKDWNTIRQESREEIYRQEKEED